MNNISRILYSNLLLIPIISHWILPDSVEQKFYIDILGFPFYFFGICYFIYILNYHRNKKDSVFKASYRNRIKLYGILFLLLSFLIGAICSVDGLLYLMIDNQAIIFCAFFFLLYPLSINQIENTKYLIIPSLIVCCAEVILYSLGILTYSIALSDEFYGSFMRISTTIGAATGTSYAILSIGVVSLCCYNYSNKIRYSLAILTTVTLFLSMSRTSLVIWCFFVVVYFYKRYITHSSFSRKLIAICCLSIVCGLIGMSGVADPIIERQSVLKSNGDINSGRGELESQALNIARNNQYLGVGCGQLNMDKSLKELLKPSHPCGVHNIYYLIFAEEGFVGILIFFVLLFTIARNLDYSNILSIFVLLQMLICFQYDYCWIEYEYIPIFYFIVMLCTKRFPSQKTIINIGKS